MRAGGKAVAGRWTGISVAGTLALFLVAFLLGGRAAFAAERALDIAVGGQRILKLERTIDRIAIADPGTIDVKVVSSRELRVLGQKEGTTDLTIWFAGTDASLSYHVVVGADLKGLQAEFSRDSALSGVKAVETGRGVVLKGQVYSLEDRQKARSLARS
jgi:Flp pilus assembly secretin CpaC